MATPPRPFRRSTPAAFALLWALAASSSSAWASDFPTTAPPETDGRADGGAAEDPAHQGEAASAHEGTEHDSASDFGAEAPPPPGSLPPPSSALSPGTDDGAQLGSLEHGVIGALQEGALDVGIAAQVVPPELLDQELRDRPAGESAPWLLSARVTPAGELWRIEVTAVPPGTSVRRVAVDVVEAERLEVRTMVLLRDVATIPTEPTEPPTPVAATESRAPRSAGRAVLALNTALLGGAIGVSLHQAGASEDDRLLYPLAALGVGIGLGASMLVADEWDITTDDAWFLSAGMVWPATSGVLLATSYDVRQEHSYLYGLAGTAAGVTLATIAVANNRVDDGGAALAHSGAAFGLGMGALAEGIVRGDLVNTPLAGMGYGAGVGVLAAGIAATQVETSSSRVLLVDLAALLGGLTGGALGTPLLLGDELDDTRRRLWFGSIALGTAAGALVGMLATSDDVPANEAAERSGLRRTPPLVERWSPHAGVIGMSQVGHETAPAFGAGVQGLW